MFTAKAETGIKLHSKKVIFLSTLFLIVVARFMALKDTLHKD
jgi:hypothetical protein